MKTHASHLQTNAPLPVGRNPIHGFTMVEIALCLAIIAFALVAIIGVMPTGIKVQRENREETIINQDGLFFLEAIRSGSKGLDELTNYVERIEIDFPGSAQTIVYTDNPADQNFLNNGAEIIGLLSGPKSQFLLNRWQEPVSIIARVKAITGVAVEKSQLNKDFAFRYQLRSEVVPFTNMPPYFLARTTTNDILIATNLLRNMYDVRLTLSWPVFEKGNDWTVGKNRKTFRTLVSAELQSNNVNGVSWFFFEPSTFTTSF
jgi:type II secretory pathway pseudopilin PulG